MNKVHFCWCFREPGLRSLSPNPVWDGGQFPSPGSSHAPPSLRVPPGYENQIFILEGTVIASKPPMATENTISFRAEDRIDRHRSPIGSPQSRSPAVSKEGLIEAAILRENSQERTLSRERSDERALEGSRERPMSREGCHDNHEVIYETTLEASGSYFREHDAEHQQTLPRQNEPTRHKTRKPTPPTSSSGKVSLYSFS